MLKIRVKDIPSQGLKVHDEMPLESFSFADTDFVIFDAPLKIDAKVSKVDNIILVQTVTTGAYVSDCYRCLERVKQSWSRDFDFDIQIAPSTEFVELDEEIRQEMILNIPVRILCREECQGLCSGCGVNLNQEKCRCPKG